MNIGSASRQAKNSGQHQETQGPILDTTTNPSLSFNNGLDYENHTANIGLGPPSRDFVQPNPGFLRESLCDDLSWEQHSVSLPLQTYGSKKRIRKEFQKFGRNIRQRLFYGFLNKHDYIEEEKRHIGPELELDNLDVLGTAPDPRTPLPNDPNGLWEADPHQLALQP